MKTIIMGDIHGEFGRLNSFISKKKPDIILQCGDFGYFPNLKSKKEFSDEPSFKKEKTPKTNNTKIYFCDGNHEDFWSLKKLNSNEIYPNVFWMKRGTTLTLEDGRVVLFFGGADSIDKDHRKIGYDWFPDENISQLEIEDLVNNVNINKIDIVISHTCPREFDLDLIGSDKHNDANRMALSFILHHYSPTSWYFGHWHIYQKSKYKNCDWTALSYLGHHQRCFEEL